MSDPNPPVVSPDFEPPSATDAQTPGKSTLKSWLIAGGAALAAVVIAIVIITVAGGKSSTKVASGASSPNGQSAAGGQSPGGGASGAFANMAVGKVTAIDGKTLTITSTQRAPRDNGGTNQSSGDNTSQTVEVEASSKTKVTTTARGTIKDLEVGDTVAVTGTESNNAITATRVVQTEMPGRNGRFAADRNGNGPNSGSSGNGGFQPPSGDFPGGNGQAANGPNGPNNLNGRSMTIGTITARTANGFTIKNLGGDSVTVSTSTATKVTITKSVSFSAIKVGDTIRATGTRSGSTLQATTIRIGADGFGGGGFGGRRFGYGNGSSNQPGDPNNSAGSTGDSSSGSINS